MLFKDDWSREKSWYANWHKNPYHSTVHWGIFIIFFLTLSAFIVQYQKSFIFDLNIVSAAVDPSSNSKNPEISTNSFLIKVKASAKGLVRTHPTPFDTGIASLNNLNRVNGVTKFGQVANRGKNSSTNSPLFQWYMVTFSGPDLKVHLHGKSIDAAQAELQKIEGLLKKYKSDSSVEAVSLNYQIQVDAVPNDPYYSAVGDIISGQPDMWGLYKINAAGAWDSATGSSNIIVASIDTGVNRNHPDIAANMWVNPAEPRNPDGTCVNDGIDHDGNGYVNDCNGWNFFANNNEPMDDHGHGTHTAGTIAAVGNNTAGVVGVNWTAKIMALKFLGAQGSGSLDDAVLALQYAADMGAKVSNNSWTCQCSTSLMDDAVKYEHDKGMVVSVAAGNSNLDALDFSPADTDDAIAVAATDYTDNKAPFSDWGQKIDVAAPGVSILSLSTAVMCGNPNALYCAVSGTSMASPHVAGLAALILSKNPNLSPEEVRQIIRKGADDLAPAGQDSSFGYGRINAKNSIDLAMATRPLTPFISSPTSRTVIAGTSVPITGSVGGPNFASYKLEYSPGRTGSSWATLSTSLTQPSSPQTIATINSFNIPDGQYEFRLTATDTSGYNYQFQIFDVTVHNFNMAITSPGGYANKGSVPVVGTVGIANNSLSLSKYVLEYGLGSSPTTWTTIATGASAITNGQLGVWDTSQLQDQTEYTLRLTVFASNGVTSTLTSVVTTDFEMLSGWPKPINPGGYTNGGSGLLQGAADLLGDGKKEIVVNDGSIIYAYRADGTQLPGFPITIPGSYYYNNPGCGIDRQVLLADVNNDGKQDIVVNVGCFDSSNSIWHNSVLVYSGDGQMLSSWTSPVISDQVIGLVAGQQMFYSFFADINGDGKKEIVEFRIGADATNDFKVWAFDSTGKLLSGFPRTGVDPVSPDPDWGTWHSNVELVDLDHNGTYEFAFGEVDRAYLVDMNMQVLPGWPYQMPAGPTAGVRRVLWWTDKFSSGDFFGNGHSEIFFASNEGCTSGCNIPYDPLLFGINKDGTNISGWPKSASVDGVWAYTQPTLADINNDGADDVLSNLAYTKSGNITLNTASNIPLDVNGDGQIDYGGSSIIQTLGGSIIFWRNIETSSTYYAYADLLGDGRLELITTHFLRDSTGVYVVGTELMVWKLDFGKQSHFDWPVLGQNIFRTNNLGTSVATSTGSAHMTLTPATLGFTTVSSGAAPSSQTSTLADSGTISLTYSATTNQTWCHVAGNSGTLPAGSSATMTVLVDTLPSVGTFQCLVTISGNADNSPQTMTVNYKTTAPNPSDTTLPTVIITSPVSGAIVTSKTPVSIQAQASDNLGVTKVEFYVNNILSCTDATSPYTCAWKVPGGKSKSYSLQTKAYDAAGNMGTSTIVKVTGR